MSMDQVKAVLERVLSWPAKRQRDAAEMLLLMEEQDKVSHRLSDADVEEVKQRLADANPRYMTLQEARERLRRRA